MMKKSLVICLILIISAILISCYSCQKKQVEIDIISIDETVLDSSDVDVNAVEVKDFKICLSSEDLSERYCEASFICNIQTATFKDEISAIAFSDNYLQSFDGKPCDTKPFSINDFEGYTIVTFIGSRNGNGHILILRKGSNFIQSSSFDLETDDLITTTLWFINN